MDVRYGSLAESTARISDVRFPLKSGHAQRRDESLLSASNGHESELAAPRVPDGLVRSKPTHKQEYKEDNEDDAEDTDAAVTEAVTVAAEATTEAA
jgi:hypothetical protein